MKKIYTLLLILLLLLNVSACHPIKTTADATTNMDKTTADVTTNTDGTNNQAPNPLDNITIYHKGNVVPDEETAIALAKIYFENVIQKEGYCPEYVYGGVNYNADNKYYSVWFHENSDQKEGSFLLGACYTIAIDEETGEVLKMYPGE